MQARFAAGRSKSLVIPKKQKTRLRQVMQAPPEKPRCSRPRGNQRAPLQNRFPKRARLRAPNSEAPRKPGTDPWRSHLAQGAASGGRYGNLQGEKGTCGEGLVLRAVREAHLGQQAHKGTGSGTPGVGARGRGWHLTWGDARSAPCHDDPHPDGTGLTMLTHCPLRRRRRRRRFKRGPRPARPALAPPAPCDASRRGGPAPPPMTQA